MMSPERMRELRKAMLDRRNELLGEREGLQKTWTAMREPEVELEERAQKEALSKGIPNLDERNLAQVEAIDAALSRMETGQYGICLACGREIPEKRLAAVPWAALDARCQKEAEKRGLGPRPGRLPEPTERPDYSGLTRDELAEAILDELTVDGRVSLEELEVEVKDGKVILTGTLPSESERAVLLSIVQDAMGLSGVTDRLRIDPVPWEREDRNPGRDQSPTYVEEYVSGRPLDDSDLERDVVESMKLGEPYTPSDRLVPESLPGEE